MTFTHFKNAFRAMDWYVPSAFWGWCSRQKVEWKSLRRVRLFASPWTIACQAPLSMEFSKQEYWSGLPFLFPWDLTDPGIEPRCPALQAGGKIPHQINHHNRATLKVSTLVEIAWTSSYKTWIFIERIEAEDEAPILWPPDAKSQLTRKDPDAGKDWR